MNQSIAERARSGDEERAHVLQIMNILRINLAAFGADYKEGWIPVSTQLFTLFCDRTRGRTLIERVLPQFVLHPIWRSIPKDQLTIRYLFYVFGRISLESDGQTSRVILDLVDRSLPKVPINDWLRYLVFIGSVNDVPVNVSVHDLISEARNQAGGGHYDPKIRAVIQAIEGNFLTLGGTEYSALAIYTAAIGNYVLIELEHQL